MKNKYKYKNSITKTVVLVSNYILNCNIINTMEENFFSDEKFFYKDEYLEEKNNEIYNILNKSYFIICNNTYCKEKINNDKKKLFEFFRDELIKGLFENERDDEFYEILQNLRFENNEDFDKIIIILNAFHSEKGICAINEECKYNGKVCSEKWEIFFNTLQKFIYRYKKKNPLDKLKKTVENIFKKIEFPEISDEECTGCFGKIKLSNSYKNLAFKEIYKVPLGNQTNYYLKEKYKIEDETETEDIINYINENFEERVNLDRLNKHNDMERDHYWRLRNILLNNSCNYIANIDNYYAIYERINVIKYDDFITNFVYNNIKYLNKHQCDYILFNYIQYFNILNKFHDELRRIKHPSIFTKDNGPRNFGLCNDGCGSVIKFDNDAFSFSNYKFSTTPIDSFITKCFPSFSYGGSKEIKTLLYIYKEYCNKIGTYDVDFFYSLLNEAYGDTNLIYKYSLMYKYYCFFNKILDDFTTKSFYKEDKKVFLKKIDTIKDNILNVRNKISNFMGEIIKNKNFNRKKIFSPCCIYFKKLNLEDWDFTKSPYTISQKNIEYNFDVDDIYLSRYKFYECIEYYFYKKIVKMVGINIYHNYSKDETIYDKDNFETLFNLIKDMKKFKWINLENYNCPPLGYVRPNYEKDEYFRLTNFFYDSYFINKYGYKYSYRDFIISNNKSLTFDDIIDYKLSYYEDYKCTILEKIEFKNLDYIEHIKKNFFSEFCSKNYIEKKQEKLLLTNFEILKFYFKEEYEDIKNSLLDKFCNGYNYEVYNKYLEQIKMLFINNTFNIGLGLFFYLGLGDYFLEYNKKIRRDICGKLNDYYDFFIKNIQDFYYDADLLQDIKKINELYCYIEILGEYKYYDEDTNKNNENKNKRIDDLTNKFSNILLKNSIFDEIKQINDEYESKFKRSNYNLKTKDDIINILKKLLNGFISNIDSKSLKDKFSEIDEIIKSIEVFKKVLEKYYDVQERWVQERLVKAKWVKVRCEKENREFKYIIVTNDDKIIETNNDKIIETNNDKNIETNNDKNIETNNDKNIETNNDKNIETNNDKNIETNNDKNIKTFDLKPFEYDNDEDEKNMEETKKYFYDILDTFTKYLKNILSYTYNEDDEHLLTE